MLASVDDEAKTDGNDDAEQRASPEHGFLPHTHSDGEA